MNGLLQNLEQDFMIERRKMLHNVAAQNIAVLLCEFPQPVYRTMRSFLFAIGIRISNKLCFKNRFDDIANGVMNDTITKRRGADFSLLRFVNHEMHVFPRLISEVR